MTTVFKCPSCGNENESNAKFCSSCGTKLQTIVEDKVSETIICSSCGIVNQHSATQCVGCGSTLAEEEKKSNTETSHRKESKTGLQKNMWLKQIVAVFAVIVLFIVVYEYLTIPTPEIVRGNTVQQQQSMPQDHNHTDSNALQKINELEAALKTNPSNAELLLEFANRLQDARFFPRAIEAYKKYLNLNRSDVDARVDLGICYFESGEIETAVSEIESVIKVQPKHQMAMFNLGIIYLNTNNLKKSNEWFTKCVEVNPSTEIAQRAQQILTQHKPN